MIDKIECKNRIGCDIHKQLIALLQYAQEHDGDLPERILEEEYKVVQNNKENYPDWYLGLVGFCASFGAKYFGGYARDSKSDNSGKWSSGAIKNLRKQLSQIKDVKFRNIRFQDLPLVKILVSYGGMYLEDYLVTSNYGQWDNIFIVLANDAKDAIEQVYQSYVVPMNEDIKRKNKVVGYNSYRICLKSELHASSIKNLHSKDGKIIRVN